MMLVIFILLLCTCIVFFYLSWRFRITKLATYHSPLLGTIHVFEKYNHERLLTINGYSQGLSISQPSITKSYWYAIAKKVIGHVKDKKNPKVLILGLGGNTTSLLIQREYPSVYFTIIEIDKEIIQACREWFGLDQLHHLKLIQGDAYKYIFDTKKIHAPFDAIVIDIFSGKSQELHTKDKAVLQQLLKISKLNGKLIFNWPANSDKTKEEATTITTYYKTQGYNVSQEYIEDPRGYKNFVISVET